MDEILNTPAPLNTGGGAVVSGGLETGGGNVTGRDDFSTPTSNNPQLNTNVYISLADYLRDTIKDAGGDMSMETEREFRRLFNGIGVSLERVAVTVDNLSKEMARNSNWTAESISALKQQITATDELVKAYQSYVSAYQKTMEEQVAGLKLAPEERIKGASSRQTENQIRQQNLLIMGVWLLVILFAAQNFGLFDRWTGG